ncbi:MULTISPECIES: ecotin [unclassified Synechococcus]|uniref:ecotin n=1 Tax=unclassified Synechococcus TaxID=2626047 RepID=UPI001E38466D|nr:MULTISPECIES: ecotin family protein [unclassified Synechococcus]CAK6688093.1 Ecotin [Synechococcus sp. CBW1107]
MTGFQAPVPVTPIARMAFAGLALGVLLAGQGAARAIPRLDLKPFPAAAAGERRWVIQLPGLLQPSPDPALSPHPADWRVELMVGRTMEVDCNHRRLGGSIKAESLKGWGYTIYRVTAPGPVASTLMACPPNEKPQQAFVTLGGGKPFVVPYNASLPIVLYAPADLEVRWRLWKAEKRQRPAQVL